MISSIIKKFRSIFKRKIVLLHRWNTEVVLVTVDTSGKVPIVRYSYSIYILKPDGTVCGDGRILRWEPYKGFTEAEKRLYNI